MNSVPFDDCIKSALPALEKRLTDDLRPVENEYSLTAEEDTDCTPIVVCELISRSNLNRWLNKGEGDLQRWQYKPRTSTRGSVVVYNLPTIVHTIAASEVVDMIREQIMAINPAARLMRTLQLAGSARFDVGDRLQGADQSLVPAGAEPGTYPNLVVEVAYKHEPWEDLLEKLRRWMRPLTTVQVAVGIGIGLIRKRIIVMRRRVRFNFRGGEEHWNTSEVMDFDFGFNHEIRFPLAALYFGVDLPDALVDHKDAEVVLDLMELRGAINSVIPRKMLRKE